MWVSGRPHSEPDVGGLSCCLVLSYRLCRAQGTGWLWELPPHRSSVRLWPDPQPTSASSAMRDGAVWRESTSSSPPSRRAWITRSHAPPCSFLLPLRIHPCRLRFSDRRCWTFHSLYSFPGNQTCSLFPLLGVRLKNIKKFPQFKNIKSELPFLFQLSYYLDYHQCFSDTDSSVMIVLVHIPKCSWADVSQEQIPRSSCAHFPRMCFQRPVKTLPGSRGVPFLLPILGSMDF